MKKDKKKDWIWIFIIVWIFIVVIAFALLSVLFLNGYGKNLPKDRLKFCEVYCNETLEPEQFYVVNCLEQWDFQCTCNANESNRLEICFMKNQIEVK